MILMHTGLPGGGKTLRSVSLIEKRRIAENRTVYYSDRLEEVTLEGWLPMPDPQKWYELPAGSILYFPEVQKTWPKRANGAPVPESEARFETHRHHGFDVYFDTQDPTFIDSHLRKLVDVHYHMMRKFGSPWVSVHEFKGTKDTVSKTRKDSIETQWLNDKAMYGKFKSAEIHTNKIRIPPKIILASTLPFIIIGLAYSFYQRRINDQQPDKPPPAVGAPMAGAASPSSVTPAVKRTYDLAAFAPRLDGLPHTAPRYDELTAPVRVPTVAGCVWFEKTQRGHCYTQQGTLLTPPNDFIKQYIQRGMFEDHERGPGLANVVQGNKAPDESKPLTRPQAPAATVAAPS
ncbi:MAG: zonular occludens toxin domain-containing protein [Polaromonas sp.]|uniref:zonular occludens toxin domain-containing protein n=1 Tax=Polaromonas sp. TaxID=1869339 RepID=UPI0027325544|nr:zonular occludens toxin domain-containing protein [Polaromonas sp.]MDP2818319.1 zonular occludens toxin domain-containing protein [Polaromonas sp.]